MRICNAPAGSAPSGRISFHGRERLLFVRQAGSEKSFSLCHCEHAELHLFALECVFEHLNIIAYVYMQGWSNSGGKGVFVDAFFYFI